MYLSKKEGYEIIRFIERGDCCHASLDYVEGITLYDWVNKHQEIDKQVLDKWLKELYQQLVFFHRQKGMPEYGKLTPYNIVVMRKNQIALMANKESNHVRSLDKFFSINSVEQNVDVYCFGKIIQYIMAHIQCKPRLTILEEFKLQRLVKRCLETNPKIQCRDILTIHSNFKQNLKWNKKLGVIIAVIFLIIGILGLGRGNIFSKEDDKTTEKMHTKIDKVPVTEDERTKEKEELEDILSTAGIDYFLEVEDYKKSVLCLKNADIQEKKVQFFLKLAEYMSGDKTATDLQILGENLNQEYVKEVTGGIKEVIALLRVYNEIKQGEKSFEILNFIEKDDILAQRESLSRKLRVEFEKYRAIAFEETEKWKEAGEAYSALCKENQKLEEEAEEFQKKSFEMNIRYLEKKWNDEFTDEEKKIGDIKQLITQNTNIIGYDIFQNFIKENKIHVEQGKIWIGESQQAP